MKKERIAVGVILLFFVGYLVPVSGHAAHGPLVASNGNWWYVGGGGPGNFTRIQDAIDNASAGDTVFVYDDAAPYVENIVVDVSISLVGEQKSSTIINGSTNASGENMTDWFGVWITADNVTVRGFTVQGCNLSGVFLSSNHSTISDTIVSQNKNNGITIGCLNVSQPYNCRENTLRNCLIEQNLLGLHVSGQNNIITGNVISQNDLGITVMFSLNSNISHNQITQDTNGVYLAGSYRTVLYRNNISYNDRGIYAMMTSADRILQNNFIGNNESASSAQMFLIQLVSRYKGEISFPIRRNVWNENYWDKPRSHPYKSPGVLWFFIDWHPAQEPYDI